MSETTPTTLAELIPGSNTQARTSISPRAQRFVDELMVHNIVSKACRDSGYTHTTFPTEEGVYEEVERRRKELAAKLHITAERVLFEYARVGFFDPRRLFHSDGRPKDITELDDDTVAALAGFDLETQGEDKNWKATHKYKFVSKLPALDSLGKHLGLFPKESSQLNTNLSVTESALLENMGENELVRRLAFILFTAQQKLKALPEAVDFEEVQKE